MIRLLRLLPVAVLAACGPSGRGPADFAREPEAAEAVVAECDAGRRRRDCEAARRGLAEARREARMAEYEAAFEADPS